MIWGFFSSLVERCRRKCCKGRCCNCKCCDCECCNNCCNKENAIRERAHSLTVVETIKTTPESGPADQGLSTPLSGPGEQRLSTLRATPIDHLIQERKPDQADGTATENKQHARNSQEERVLDISDEELAEVVRPGNKRVAPTTTPIAIDSVIQQSLCSRILSARWTLRCAAGLLGRLTLMALGAGATYLTNRLVRDDENLDNAAYYVLSTFVVGFSYRLFINVYCPPKAKKLHDRYEDFNPEELAVQAFLLGLFAPWQSNGAWQIQYVWGGLRTGEIFVETGHRFYDRYTALKLRRQQARLNAQETQRAFLPPVRTDSTVPQSYRDVVRPFPWKSVCLKIIVGSGCVTIGVMGLNLPGNALWGVPSIIINDVGLITLMSIFGERIERFFQNSFVLNKLMRMFFFSTLNPGATVQNFVRVGLFGMIYGYINNSKARYIGQRRRAIEKQSERIHDICQRHPEFFAQIQENVIAWEQQANNPKTRRNKIILQVAASFIPWISYAASGDLTTLYSQVMGYFLLVFYHLSHKVRLTPYQDFKVQHQSGKMLWVRKQLHYFLHENPTLMAVFYGYVLRVWDRLYAQNDPSSTNLENWLQVYLYANFCAIWGTERANEYHLAFLNRDTFKHMLAELTRVTPPGLIQAGREDIELSIEEQRYLHEIAKERMVPALPVSEARSSTPPSWRLTTVVKKHKADRSQLIDFLRATSFFKDAMRPIPGLDFHEFGQRLTP